MEENKAQYNCIKLGLIKLSEIVSFYICQLFFDHILHDSKAIEFHSLSYIKASLLGQQQQQFLLLCHFLQ